MKFDFVMKKRRRLLNFSKAQVRAIRFHAAQSSEHKHPNLQNKLIIHENKFITKNYK